MNLREYVDKRRELRAWTIRGMANELGVKASHLYNVVNKNVSPSWKLAMKIEKYSGGKVKAADIMNEEYENKKPFSIHRETNKTKAMTNNTTPAIPQITSG